MRDSSSILSGVLPQALLIIVRRVEIIDILVIKTRSIPRLPTVATCSFIYTFTVRQIGAALDPVSIQDSTPKMATSYVTRAGGMQQLLYGAWYGWQWSREGLPHRVRHLVLDEADLLLSGGFLDQTQRLLEVGIQ